jgi:phosphate transport system substrate-binding protein
VSSTEVIRSYSVKSNSIRLAALPAVAVLTLALSACGGADAGTASGSEDGDAASGGASGSVKIDGSSTVFPMSDAAGELLNEENPDIKVSVSESGTGGGFEKFCAGQTDISDASRPIEKEGAK